MEAEAGRMAMTPESTYIARPGEKSFTISVTGETAKVDGRNIKFRFTPHKGGFCTLEIDGRIIQAFYRKKNESQYDIWFDSHAFTVDLEDPAHRALHQIQQQGGSTSEPVKLRAPMPGLVTTIEVGVGDEVKPGQGLLILEAMKMENEIRSPIHGKIMSIDVSNSATVEKDQKLMTIERITRE
jgi:biotin carboxyl carrier protein